MQVSWRPLVFPVVALSALLAADPSAMVQSVNASDRLTAPEAVEEPITREEIRSSIRKYFGSPLPGQAIAPELEILEKIDVGDHERWHLHAMSEGEN